MIYIILIYILLLLLIFKYLNIFNIINIKKSIEGIILFYNLSNLVNFPMDSGMDQLKLLLYKSLFIY